MAPRAREFDVGAIAEFEDATPHDERRALSLAQPPCARFRGRTVVRVLRPDDKEGVPGSTSLDLVLNEGRDCTALAEAGGIFGGKGRYDHDNCARRPSV